MYKQETGWPAWDAAAMLEQYRQTLRRLEARRQQVAAQAKGFTRRLETLDQEIDEVAEVLRCLRQYTD